MTAYLTEWMTVLVVTGLTLASPGPNIAITVKNSLVHSRRAGI